MATRKKKALKVATRKKKAPKAATRKKKASKDEVLALLIEIRDELRAANSRTKRWDAALERSAASVETGVVATMPELDATLRALHESVEELKRVVTTELAWGADPARR